MMIRITVIACLLGMFCTAKAGADALDEIADRGTIRLGVRAAAPPFSFIDEAGQPSGLAVSLCRRIAVSIGERLGLTSMTTDYVVVDSLTRFSMLENGEVDLHCGPMTATLARREIVDFSIPYYMDGVGAALREGGVPEISALSGQPVGALAGTTAVETAKAFSAKGASELIEFTSHQAGLRALGDGLIDVYFGDQGLLLHQLSVLKKENPTMPIEVLDEQFTFEPYAIAMRAGEHRLRVEADRALSAIYRSDDIFTELEAALGPSNLSDLTALIYALMALPE